MGSVLESIVDRLKSFFSLLAPPRLVSWQSMFLFGASLWIVSAVVNLADPKNVVELYILRRTGWFFIAGGVVWRQALDPVKFLGVPIGALAAASVVITFFFENEAQEWTQLGFILWPLLSGVLVTLSYFLATSGHWRIPSQLERIKAIVALAVGIILACWLKFYFVSQDWMVKYPRLWDAKIDHSSFMATLQDPRETLGEQLVGEVDKLLYRQFNGQAWPEIEKQLQQYLRDPNRMENELKEGSDERPPVTLPFGSDWDVSFAVAGTGDPSYMLMTTTTWKSPLPFDDRDFSVIRVCEVTRAPLPLELFNEATQTGLLECNTSPEFIFADRQEMPEAKSNKKPNEKPNSQPNAQPNTQPNAQPNAKNGDEKPNPQATPK
jgi:hypothetical protein